ncbi:MAG: hypothetical protein M1824_002476 [Vezdaea acicularis]|nr:MAG: hypothetical protein M1824_002476 [Vezdaea acicularis]
MKHSPSSLTLLSALIIQSAFAIPCPPAGNSSSLAPWYPTGNNFSSTISPSAYAPLSSTYLPYESPVLSAITDIPAPWEAPSASTLAPVIYSSTDAPLPTSLERRDDWWAGDTPVASPWVPHTPVGSPWAPYSPVASSWAPETPVASPWRTYVTPSPDTRDSWQSPTPWALSPRAPEPQFDAIAAAIAQATDTAQPSDISQEMARIEKANQTALALIQRRSTRFAPGSVAQASTSIWEVPAPQSTEMQASASSWETQAPQPVDETYWYDAITDPAPSPYSEPEQNWAQQFGKREPLRLASENGTQYNQANYTQGSGSGQVNSTVNSMLSQRSPQLNETWVPAPQYTSTIEAQQAGFDPQTLPEPIEVEDPVLSSEDDGTPSFDRRKRSPIAQDQSLPSAMISAITSIGDPQPVTPTIDQPIAGPPAPEPPAPEPPAPEPPAPEPPAPVQITHEQPESPVINSNGIEPNYDAELNTGPNEYGSLSMAPYARLSRRFAEPQDSASYSSHDYWTESMNSDRPGELEQYDRPGVEWFQKRSAEPQDSASYTTHDYWTEAMNSDRPGELEQYDRPGVEWFQKRSAEPQDSASYTTHDYWTEAMNSDRPSELEQYDQPSAEWFQKRSPSPQDVSTSIQNIWDALQSESGGDSGLQIADTIPPSDAGNAGTFRKRSAEPEPQTYSGSDTAGYTGSTSGYGNTDPGSATGTTGTTDGTAPAPWHGEPSGLSEGGTTVGVAGRIKFRRRAA